VDVDEGGPGGVDVEEGSDDEGLTACDASVRPAGPSQRKCMRWARPAQEKSWGPPPCNGDANRSSESASDDAEDDGTVAGEVNSRGKK
jgi:hypothetical protein